MGRELNLTGSQIGRAHIFLPFPVIGEYPLDHSVTKDSGASSLGVQWV